MCSILAKGVKARWILEGFAWTIFVLFQGTNKIVRQDGMVITKTRNQIALVGFSLPDYNLWIGQYFGFGLSNKRKK